MFNDGLHTFLCPSDDAGFSRTEGRALREGEGAAPSTYGLLIKEGIMLSAFCTPFRTEEDEEQLPEGEGVKSEVVFTIFPEVDGGDDSVRLNFESADDGANISWCEKELEEGASTSDDNSRRDNFNAGSLPLDSPFSFPISARDFDLPLAIKIFSELE
jgi:hypothetical protein